MNKEPVFQKRFERFNCCVIVPTYNNSQSLEAFLTELKLFTKNIIIINDGSTDGTADILKKYKEFHQRTQSENKGKGTALKTGFQFAEELGYDYAITIDSDGQHYPDDLDVFLKELEVANYEEANLLLVGDRNMGSEGIPNKSSIGNQFSSFWYTVVTGQELKDTQSGYRLYPVKLINSLKLITWKFELEIEVLVKAVWKNAEVRNVPIKVFYEEGERVTHFRPFRDIVRIVLLFMWFVFVSFFWIHPRNKYRNFRKLFYEKWPTEILNSLNNPQKKAGAVALGVFIGLSPFIGLHSLLVFLLSSLFKINKPVTLFLSNISVLPFIPGIIFTSYLAGRFINQNLFETPESSSSLIQVLENYFVGSLSLASITAMVCWIIFYFKFFRNLPDR
ncbi:DUF2062 domain-containing protein [Christiangramia aquimixticola]|uniref:DUF2062 domain-containing protein n=1 Tax=Christiangramia aquimixticola TaxID=1697558 RepID=UPI003AA83A21